VVAQKASGAWDVDDLVSFLKGGLSASALTRELLANVKGLKNKDKDDQEVRLILGTLLGIALLEARFGGQHEEWALVERKAKTWLKKTIVACALTDEDLSTLTANAKRLAAPK
jgi:hypothetical protein